jgi:CelD/BcsL family acetyltransferase involved in cellulose biosynthesis
MRDIMALEVEIISQQARFIELAPQWDELWRRCDGEIFQSHAWIAAWLGIYHKNIRLRIAVAWQGTELVAVVPLVIRRKLGLRRLEWAAQSLSDYCDVLATPDAAPYLRDLWDAVWRLGGFDLVNVQQIKPEAVTRRLLDESATISRRGHWQKRCYAINCVWSDGEAWFRSLGKKGRNNFWRGERILTSLGGEVQFHCIDPHNQSIESELLHTFALKRTWLRAAKPNSALLGRDGQALEAMLRAVSTMGQMRLFVLTCGDKIAATSINFICGQGMQAYLTAYDPAFDKASPGTILIVRYTRWAFDHGLRIVDFLRGDESFKSRLANCEVILHSYGGARTLFGRAAIAVNQRRVRPRHTAPGATAKALEPQATSSPFLSNDG